MCKTHNMEQNQMDNLNIVDFLHQRSIQNPRAILFTTASESISFKEMVNQVNQLANALLSLNVSSGERIAILSKSQFNTALLLFACMKIGAVCMPINWRFSSDEIKYVLNDSNARILISDGEFLSHKAELMTLTNLEHLFITDHLDPKPTQLNQWYKKFSDQYTSDKISPKDDAVHIYSSGTTGQPKGVVLTHQGLISACEVTIQAWGLNNNAILGHILPTFHIAGLLMLVFPVYVGCNCVTFHDFQPVAFLSSLSDKKISHVLLVPAMINLLSAQASARTLNFDNLKLIAYAGSPITESVLQTAIEIFNCDFSQIYGLTEVSGVVTILTATDHRIAKNLLRSAGRPFPDTELRVVDPITCVDLEDGCVGEIWIRSLRNFKEYWQNPTATNDAYPEARDNKGGWFRSGDAGYLKDGYLFLSDRIKDMIISGGENIYPAEVENILMKHPHIADVAVIGVPDDLWGESVKACVVVQPNSQVRETELIEFVRDKIAHFKCPKTVDFLEALPRTESGKLLKRDLRQKYWIDYTRLVN